MSRKLAWKSRTTGDLTGDAGSGDLDLSFTGDLDSDLARAGEAERALEGDLLSPLSPLVASMGSASGLGEPSSDIFAASHHSQNLELHKNICDDDAD